MRGGATMLEKTLESLKSAGWHVGRKIDTKSIEEYLSSRGFEIFPMAITFLQEFGMLEFKVPREGRNEKIDTHHTIPEKAMGEVFGRDDVREYESYAGEPLIIVGELFDRNMNLFISTSGKYIVTWVNTEILLKKG
jgi:hypothetical protein